MCCWKLHEKHHTAGDIVGNGIDVSGIAKDAGTCAGVADNIKCHQGSAGNGAHDAGDDKGLLLGQGQAVDRRLGNTCDTGDQCGDAQALGLAEGALETTIEYVKERKQFGRSIGQFQNTQFQLADMATKVEAAKLLVYKAAMAKATQKTYSFEAAQAKLCAAEVAMEVTTKAVQLHGGYGYIREYDVERMMRDAKITEIYEGTSEVQRMVISANLLK